MVNYILRPVLTASRPSHTMAQIGPLSISSDMREPDVRFWKHMAPKTYR